MISLLSTAFLGLLRMAAGFMTVVMVFSLMYLALSINEVFWAVVIGIIVAAAYKVGKY